MAKQLVYQFDIGGQTRTLNFGMLAWDIFCEAMDISLGKSMEPFARVKMENGIPATDEKGEIQYEESPHIGRAARTICYAGIVANDRLNRVPDSVSLDDMNQWYNDDPEMMASIASVAINTRIEKIKEKLQAAEGGKKKVSRSKTSKK